MTSVECPYSGPMPLRVGQTIFGREQDLGLLMVMIRQRQLVTLTAASGVGKTSLLQAGLIPALEARDYVIARFSEWGTLEGEDDAERFVRAIRRGLGEDPHSDEDILQTLERWRAIYGARLVVVFDQFEELFRQDRGLGIGILGAIGDCLTGDTLYPFRFVLSLRTEFRDEIGVLEGVLDPNTYDSYRLEELGPEVAETVITESLLAIPQPGVRMSPDTARLIASGWRLAVADDVAGRDVRIGLLHLQALMWVVWQELDPSLGSVIHSGDMRAVGIPEDFASVAVTARDVFVTALREYADRRLREFERALAVDGGKPNQAMETRYLLAAIAPRLSSGGYKLIWETPDLAAEALPDALQDMDISDALLAEAVCWLEDLDASGRADEATLSEGLRRVFVAHSPDLGEQQDASIANVAGRLFGASPAVVATELVLAFWRAISWLEDAYIVRTSHTRRNTRIVSLIHDGFGEQLKLWAKQVQAETSSAFSSVVAISGVRVFAPTLDVGGKRAVVVTETGTKKHVVWQGCIVTADLSDIEFLECDFRGTLFLGSTFRNVTFRDCILWGALFKACHFDGVVFESTVDGGFGSGLPVPPTERLDAVQTLTIGPLGSIAGDGITLRGLDGYGVFRVEVMGGPFVVENCTLNHVAVKDAATTSQTHLKGTTRIRFFDHDVPEQSTLVMDDTVVLEKSSYRNASTR